MENNEWIDYLSEPLKKAPRTSRRIRIPVRAGDTASQMGFGTPIMVRRLKRKIQIEVRYEG